jgi:hypothetical protein
LDNAPVKGDSSGGFPGGSGINVRPDGLKLFSTQAQGEAMNFSKGYAEGVAPLTMGSGQIGASFQEAAQFSARHMAAIDKIVQLNAHVGEGLMAFWAGAHTIAVNYLDGDAMSAATVLNVFAPSKGNGVNDQVEGGGQQSGGGGTSRLPEGKVVDTENTSKPNHPGLPQTIDLGDNASYTMPGAPNCLDIEMATPEASKAVQEPVHEHLAKVGGYEPAPYDPDNYR